MGSPMRKLIDPTSYSGSWVTTLRRDERRVIQKKKIEKKLSGLQFSYVCEEVNYRSRLLQVSLSWTGSVWGKTRSNRGGDWAIGMVASGEGWLSRLWMVRNFIIRWHWFKAIRSERHSPCINLLKKLKLCDEVVQKSTQTSRIWYKDTSSCLEVFETLGYVFHIFYSFFRKLARSKTNEIYFHA